MYKDDINSAFHRCRYHPDVVAAYAYVYGNWLVIPVGLIFGGRNSPGWFCILSELRAYLAANLSNLSDLPISPLVAKIVIPDPPSPEVTATFATASADSMHHGAASDGKDPTSHSTFVDDNLMAKIQGRIIDSIHRSTGSCYMVFGQPCPNVRIPSLSEDKYVAAESHRME